MTLTDSERAEIRELLEELATKLEARIHVSADQAQPVNLDEPIGRLSRMDAIQMQQTASIQNQNLVDETNMKRQTQYQDYAFGELPTE